MKRERTVLAYKTYFRDFINSLSDDEARKVFYVIVCLRHKNALMQNSLSICATRYTNFARNTAATYFVCSSFLTKATWLCSLMVFVKRRRKRHKVR